MGLCLAVGRMELRNYVRGVRSWRGQEGTLLLQAIKFCRGLQPNTFFFFAMYPGDFTLGNELAMNELFWK